MLRHPMTAILLLGCCAALACQTYTKSLEKSITRADEVGAISALHTIVSTERAYSISNGGNYATFPELAKTGLLDQRFDSETPKLKGYVLAMAISKGAGSGEASYTLSADPEGPGPDPGRHFFVDSMGMIHVNPSQPATATDPPLGQ